MLTQTNLAFRIGFDVAPAIAPATFKAFRQQEISSPSAVRRWPELVQDDVVARALFDDKVCNRVMSKQRRPKAGDLVGVRLNLNLFKSRGVPVQTLHKGNSAGRHAQGKGFFNGEVLWYQKVVVLRDCYLNVGQAGREKIASGAESKHPIASADGILVDDESPSFDGLEVRFNPHETHLFISPDNRAVMWVEEATIYAHRLYCRGAIKYHNEATAPAKAGHSPSIAII